METQRTSGRRKGYSRVISAALVVGRAREKRSSGMGFQRLRRKKVRRDGVANNC